MHEESQDLGDCVRSEEEACDVGEGHDGKWIEKQEGPDAVILQVEDNCEN